MKVIYLHQYFATPKMAGGTRSYEMAKRLVASGHEVHVVTTWREKCEKKTWWSEEIDGITVHWLPVRYNNNMAFYSRIAAFAKFALGSMRKAVAIGGDVVFATSTPLTIAIPGVFASRRLKLPMVFEVRDLWPELPIAIGILRNRLAIFLAKRLERFAYNNSEQVIALSPGMARGVLDCGVSEDKVHIVPNSSDMELFAPDADGEGRFRRAHPELGDGPIVLYAGTFGLINGVSYLPILASEVLKQLPDVRFVAIGGGAEKDRIANTARELGVLEVNFFQYDRIPKMDLIDAFRAASVSTSLFVDLPEMWSNSANKFFDSLASGTALAINYKGWQAELLETHDAGIVLDKDPIQASKQMVTLLQDQPKLVRLGRNARELARQKFDRDLLAQKFISVIEEAVAPKPVSVPASKNTV